MTEGEGQSHWWRISVTVALESADRIEETLEGLGALAITRMDAGASPQFDAALPDKPRWALQSVSGLFAPETEVASVEAHLIAVAGSGSATVVDPVADQDWELSGRASFAPVQSSDRLWICPPLGSGAGRHKSDSGHDNARARFWNGHARDHATLPAADRMPGPQGAQGTGLGLWIRCAGDCGIAPRRGIRNGGRSGFQSHGGQPRKRFAERCV